ncbi:hypothetical protein AQUCO_02200291v1 [Aquilegia coerulea]|uniref:Protein kinase domain-containing protein n=1 Tax=Aquilegia coerulea TaxID=218851 RepID=A0A2G5DE46_AQUCA|nr:hypothetical protein AQUCO_02200291v1 [Aquilegia coerulea]
MEKDGGRCGYLNEERESGEEFCFCKDGIHRNNCSDGIIVNFEASGKDPQTKLGSTRRIIALVVGGVGLTILLLCSCYIYYKRRPEMKPCCFTTKDDHQALEGYFEKDSRNKEPASIETFLHNYTLGRPTRFSYKQLKKYTNNFSNKIGQGGFGSVYKGQLPNSFTIAVKVLDVATEKSVAQFLNEVLTIGRIHHNHLVRLLGYCFEQSRRALIYEYMVNGSLNKYIHQKKHGINTKGIAYLHEECQIKILHLDIKPHNILLDDKFRPKVADFGLAVLLNRDNSHVSLTHGAGTPGYAPPEMWWMKCGPVTEKSDVYSFGMLVLEMAGMRKNFEPDVSKSSEMYFPGWVFSHHVMNASSGEESRDMDSRPVVDSKWHPCEGKEEKDMAMRMELVGLWCIQFEPSKRPSMRKVVDMLEKNVIIEIPSVPFDPRFPGYGWKNNVPIASQSESTSSSEIAVSSEYLHGR